MEHHHLHILHIHIQHHLYNQHHHHHFLIHKYTTIPLQSTSTYPLPPLQSTSIYPLLPLQSSSYLNDDLFPTVKVIPELKFFLEELDAIYGERKYTQYLKA